MRYETSLLAISDVCSLFNKWANLDMRAGSGVMLQVAETPCSVNNGPLKLNGKTLASGEPFSTEKQ